MFPRNDAPYANIAFLCARVYAAVSFPFSGSAATAGAGRSAWRPARVPRPFGGRAGFGRRMPDGKTTCPPTGFSARESSALAAAAVRAGVGRAGAQNGQVSAPFIWRTQAGQATRSHSRHWHSARIPRKVPSQASQVSSRAMSARASGASPGARLCLKAEFLRFGPQGSQ